MTIDRPNQVTRPDPVDDDRLDAYINSALASMPPSNVNDEQTIPIPVQLSDGEIERLLRRCDASGWQAVIEHGPPTQVLMKPKVRGAVVRPN